MNLSGIMIKRKSNTFFQENALKNIVCKMTANLFEKDPEHRLICSMANADTKAILNHILCTKWQNVNLDSIWLPCVIIFSDHVCITSLCLFCTWSGSDINRSSPTKNILNPLVSGHTIFEICGWHIRTFFLKAWYYMLIRISLKFFGRIQFTEIQNRCR